MTGRNLLAAALKAALPDWQIVHTARQLAAVHKPGAIVMWTTTRAKAPVLGLNWFTDEIVVQVVTATDNPDAIEDDLDELLAEVLAALEPLDPFSWEKAERVALDDTRHAWQLTVTCIFQLTKENS